MCGWCERDAGWTKEHGGAGVGAKKDLRDVVASRQFFASLFVEISAKYPELAALGPRYLKGGKGACGHAQKHGDASGTARRISTGPS